jgi:signal transduction histidine kinase
MKRTSEWTWLGLPIVKSILEHMDSKITVKSEIWKWSKFSFSLKINK